MLFFILGGINMQLSIQNDKQPCLQVDKKAHKHINIFWNILLAINILIIGSFLITFFMNGCSFSKASVFGYRIVTVLSGSMEPTLDTHSMAITDMKSNDYEIGDIVVYKHEKILIIHRIIDITNNGYITKGDNNPVPDSWIVEKDQVVGKVIHIMNWTAPVLDFLFGGN